MGFKEILEGVEIEKNPRYLLIKSDSTLKALSSSVLNPGFRETKDILNLHVKKGFSDGDPVEYLRGEVEDLDLPKSTVGFLTAADVEEACIYGSCNQDFKVKAITTTGISHPIISGRTMSDENGFGTINTIVVVDGDMAGRSMVDAVRTATEAKTRALREMDVRNEDLCGSATGTTTDAISIACTERGEVSEYAGPVSSLGELIAEAVHKSVKTGVEKCGFDSMRPLKQRLGERGLSFDLLVETAENAFVEHPDSSNINRREILEKELDKVLCDLNIASLVIAGLKLEEEGEIGLIPGLSPQKFRSDPIELLADEILGMRIANYINGSKGVFEFTRIDKNKPGVLKELGPFLDDVIGGVIGGVCSRAYEIEGLD